MNLLDWFYDHPVLSVVLVIVLSLLLAFGAKCVDSYFEAKAYRKFCDTPVTLWDAMFLDLRIDECARRGS